MERYWYWFDLFVYCILIYLLAFLRGGFFWRNGGFVVSFGKVYFCHNVQKVNSKFILFDGFYIGLLINF